MKINVKLVAIAVLMVPVVASSGEKLPAVDKLRNGFYVSTVDLDGRLVKRYIVDTKAQLCFWSDEVIPCENLKMREEWKEVISWIE